jgi:GT2 family glycosyltransferase
VARVSPKPIPLPSASRPSVSIVVLLTDSVLMARECLTAIATARDNDVECEVVAVLNAVGPEVERLVEEEATAARIVRTEVNCGTAAGWNLGFEAAAAPWVALIHEDSAPRPGWLLSLLRTAEDEPHAGAIGSRLLFPDGSVENGGWVFWRDGCVTQLDERTAPSLINATAPYAVDLCSSAALMIERAAWQRIGGFDERFYPAVYADVDLCTALWALGRPVMSDPRSIVVHRKNAMVRKDGGALRSGEFQHFLVERNRRRYVQKWGRALDAYSERDQSAPPWDAPAEAVQAALERCARRYLTPPPVSDLPAVERPLTAGDPADLTRRLLAAQVDTQAAFCDALAASLATARAETADAERRLHDQSAELAHLRNCSEALERILNGRTWRTRTAVGRVLRRKG